MKNNERINLRGMIQLNQVEDLISQILIKLELQEEEIQKLKEINKQFVIHEKVDKEVSDIHNAIRRLNSRLDILRDASSLRLNDKIITSADLAYQNNLEINEIKKQLPIYAEKNITNKQIEDIYLKYDQIIEDIENNYTLNTVTTHLEENIIENIKKVTLLEESLSKKLERNEIKHIERLYNELNGYKKTFEGLQRSYNQLDQQLEEFNLQLTTQYDSLYQHINKTTNSVEVKSQQEDQKILQQLVNFQKQTQNFQSHIPQKYATLNIQNDILTTLEGFQRLFDEHELKTNELREQQKSLENILPTKANTTDIQKIYVRKDIFTNVLTSLGEEVEKKGLKDDILKQSEKLEELNTSLIKHDSQIQLTLRFIEWFTQRGDVYEYNVKVIDKHLQNLATSSITPSIPLKSFQDNQVGNLDFMMKRNIVNFNPNLKNPSLQQYSDSDIL